MKKLTQGDRILEHLKAGLTLNRVDAYSTLGILEAPARISELRAKGYPIITTMIKVCNRYGERIPVAEWSMEVASCG